MVTFENRDCMDAMRTFPDKFFDLAIVDPPYGSVIPTDDETGVHFHGRGRSQKYQEVLNTHTHTHTHTINKSSRDLEGDSTDTSDFPKTGLNRTGGTWSKKYGKKSWRGM